MLIMIENVLFYWALGRNRYAQNSKSHSRQSKFSEVPMLVEHRFVESNGIKIHIAEAGAGPLVLLCHGFPESWYSWRHQIKALSHAGYHVIAPDMRGYGQTDRPNAIHQYSLFHFSRRHGRASRRHRR